VRYGAAGPFFKDAAPHGKLFRGTPGLLGYDIWNEPYPGPAGQEALGEVMAHLPGSVNFEQKAEKAQLIAGLSDMDFYRSLTKIISRHTMPFEQDLLTPFYERTAQVIHTEDPQMLLFTEPCYFTNIGVPSGIGRLTLPGQVFSPHGYDLIVDTGHDELYDPSRIELIFQRHRETELQLGVPAFVGEWGPLRAARETKRPGNR
jgi:endoglycosylceramidase